MEYILKFELELKSHIKLEGISYHLIQVIESTFKKSMCVK
jgi:hypothetical protein